MDKQRDYLVRAPLFPLYSRVAAVLPLWDGEPVKAVRDMITAIHEQTGTPQNPVDWSNPDEWIEQRLKGKNAALAQKIWIGSGRTVNPRHVYGTYLFVNRLEVLTQEGGTYRLKDRGRRFLDKDPAILHELDGPEGMPKILSLVAEASPCKLSELVDDWGTYLQAVSKFSTPKTFADTLRLRLNNLVERELVVRDGARYSITPAGLKWLKTSPQQAGEGRIDGARTGVTTSVRAFNKAQLEAFKARLMQLAPYDFEFFVKALLEAMDYENVEVTKQSGDKGVDVVANFQFGITEIKEVVQVKRTESTIGRPIIDGLRGSLPYHNALRGTIITLGNFAKGIERDALFPGAAPITLIDGERLLELAVKHEIGVRRKPVDLLEIDEVFFATRFEAEADVEVLD